MLGTLLLALGFAVGVEPVSTSVAGQTNECGSVITPGWLSSGTPRRSVAELSETRQEQRLAARVESQCRPNLARAEWVTWGALALGGMAALIGWTALREGRLPRLPGR